MPDPGRAPQPWQEPPLASTARIRVVDAVPGSGKTWVLAQVLRSELADWHDRSAGIAALSFTNVASKEIRRALGYDLTHPHFAGTLDTFLYHSIVQPFAPWVFAGNIARPQLIPAEYVTHLANKHWSMRKPLAVKTGRGEETKHLFEFDFIGRHKDKTPQFRYKTIGRSTIFTDVVLSRQIFERKKELWRVSGRMSHSDVAYIASETLGSGERGRWVRDLLAHRFPFILLDELQDTGRYHSLAIRRLLTHECVRAFVVGDPGQAIFGFNGADPEQFKYFAALSGAHSIPMTVSARCPRNVCAVATQLATHGRTISPCEGAADGRCLILVHAGNAEPLLQLAEEIAATRPDGHVKVITRRNDDVDEMLQGGVAEVPPFKVTALTTIYRAVVDWLSGRRKAAAAHAEAAFGRMLFDTPRPTRAEREAVGIRDADWMRAMGDAILPLADLRPGESAYDWGMRAKNLLRNIILQRGWDRVCPHPVLPRAPSANTKHRPAFAATLKPAKRGFSIETVHAVKGETHHTTMLFVPPTTQEKCISAAWWSSDAQQAEERRIAFVAATRPTDTFILCVDSATLERLTELRPEFVRLFRVVPLSAAQPVRDALGLQASRCGIPQASGSTSIVASSVNP